MRRIMARLGRSHAILYQTSDQKLRKRILANYLSYEDTVAWGQSNDETQFWRVDMDPPPDAITERELQQAMEGDTDMAKLVKVVQTGHGLKELPKP